MYRRRPRTGSAVPSRVLAFRTARRFHLYCVPDGTVRFHETLRKRRTMASNPQTIYYTLTDEAPSLATCSLLPIIRTFTRPAGIDVELTDISACRTRARGVSGASSTRHNASTTGSASSASSRRIRTRTSSSCRTSVRPSRSSRTVSRSCRRRAMRCRTIPRIRNRTTSGRFRRAIRKCSAAP